MLAENYFCPSWRPAAEPVPCRFPSVTPSSRGRQPGRGDADPRNHADSGLTNIAYDVTVT